MYTWSLRVCPFLVRPCCRVDKAKLNRTETLHPKPLRPLTLDGPGRVLIPRPPSPKHPQHKPFTQLDLLFCSIHGLKTVDALGKRVSVLCLGRAAGVIPLGVLGLSLLSFAIRAQVFTVSEVRGVWGFPISRLAEP